MRRGCSRIGDLLPQVRPCRTSSSRSTRAPPARGRSCSTAPACRSRRRSANSRSTFRAPAGSSTTPRRSGRRRPRRSPKCSRARVRRRQTSPPSASPTSARRRCCGTAARAARLRRRSSGRTAARPTCASSCKADGLEPDVARRTGLLLDPYFSGTKLAWLLDHVPGARQRAEARRTRLRHDRQLAGVEADERRATRDRRVQRQPHAAAQPRQRRVGRLHARPAAHSARRAAAGRAVVPSTGTRRSPRSARTRCRSRASPATSRPRCSARPASNPAWPRTPTARAASC